MIKPHGMKKWDEPGTYQWTVPTGITEIWVSAAAGGAGGSGAGKKANISTATSYAHITPGTGGGAGDSVLKENYSVTPGAMLTIVIGLGGKAGVNGSLSKMGTPGGGGSATIVDTLLTLNPAPGASTPTATSPSGGLKASSGSIGYTKQNESTSNNNTVGVIDLGKGGNNLLGIGGNALSDNGVYGGGGVGGRTSDLDLSNWRVPGRGGDGVVIIEY